MTAAQTPSIIKNISNADQKILHRMFRHLILDDQFAYTLFGSKPMSHKGVFFDSDNQNFIENWKIWKKYAARSEFQMQNYAIKEKTYPELFEIHFLNKKNVLSCVQKHLPTFKEILGKDITPEKVYQDMTTADDVYAILGNSQILYGILFGFGEKNARGYHEKFELELDIPDPIPFNEEDPQPGHLTLPYFSVFGCHQETDVLHRTYQQERRHILSLYSKGNFLEITLTKLLSND
jgi:hypothetical protein